jgi:hypothetical protein
MSLQSLLKDVDGNAIISIDTVTTPTLKGGRANPLQGQIRKVMIGGNVMIFTNKRVNGYEAMVQRRLAKEGKDPASFELGERAWGERIAGTPFVEHNGETYLEVIFLRAGKVHYTHGVRPIDKAAITGLQEREEGQQGGLENKVVIRTFKASSISSITINGARHVL